MVVAENPVGKSTSTAYSLLAPAEECPSWPSELSPQQATVASDNSAQANFSPTAKLSDSPINGYSFTNSSINSQIKSPSVSVGVLDESLKSVPHESSSILNQPSPSISKSNPAVVIPFCFNR